MTEPLKIECLSQSAEERLPLPNAAQHRKELLNIVRNQLPKMLASSKEMVGAIGLEPVASCMAGVLTN